jgi:hypothetical protein
VFILQDQIVARLANTLGSELVKAEAEKSTHSGNPDAIDLTMRGWAILNEPRLITDKSGVAKALGLFEQALTLDPNNVDALVGAAAAERDEFQNSGMDDKPGQIARIDEMLTRAIRIDPSGADEGRECRHSGGGWRVFAQGYQATTGGLQCCRCRIRTDLRRTCCATSFEKYRGSYCSGRPALSKP